DLCLTGAAQAQVDVAPAKRLQPALLSAAANVAPRIDQVHAAEIGDPVVDDNQLAMIAAIEDAEERKPPQRFPQRMEGMHPDAGRLHPPEESCRRKAATDRIVKDAHVKPRPGSLRQGLGDS